VEFVGEVVCSVSPVWSCCQEVSGCLMTGTLILKSSITDLMPGQFLIALSDAVGLLTNQTLLMSLHTYTPCVVAETGQLENSQICGGNSVRDPGVLSPEFKDRDGRTACTCHSGTSARKEDYIQG